MILIKTEKLEKEYVSSGFLGKKRRIRALKGIDIEIKKGETYGLVGESGCGKSTFGRTVLGMEKPTAGKVYFKDTDINESESKEIKKIRRNMQIIFQDPYSSLDPSWNVKKIIEEPMKALNISQEEIYRRLDFLTEKIGFIKKYLERYPYEFSGGQRQRIGIARALATEPEFIVCDEPVSALDVSVQAQIINMLLDFQNSFNLTYLFISHDMNVVHFIAAKIGVMYKGYLVEEGESDEIMFMPRHPYTELLISAIPGNTKTDKTADNEEMKGPERLIISAHDEGCPFAGRCPYTMEKCLKKIPPLKYITKTHRVACHLI